MPDISLIASTLTCIDSAINIVKSINEANSSIKEAKSKLELADLLNSLVDTKLQIASVKSAVIEKDEKISLLENKIKQMISGEEAEYKNGCYKFGGNDGSYCTACWDKNKQKIHLTRLPVAMIRERNCRL